MKTMILLTLLIPSALTAFDGRAVDGGWYQRSERNYYLERDLNNWQYNQNQMPPPQINNYYGQPPAYNTGTEQPPAQPPPAQQQNPVNSNNPSNGSSWDDSALYPSVPE